MVKLEFKDLSFEEECNKIKIFFLKNYYFYIDKDDLRKIAEFKINKNSVEFKNINENKAKTRFNFLLESGFKTLKNSINNRKTIYIHKNSGIPLMGCLYFGIVDKGSNMIEIKPNTSCNLNCIFCSVDEGLSSRRIVDYVVEKDYLAEELNRLIESKNAKIDVYINPHGEPLLYEPLVELVKDISNIKNINILSIITNGILLTKEKVDELIKAGLNRINLSINALDGKKAKQLAGTKDYDIEQIKMIAEYISKKIKLVIAPVLIDGFNNDEMPKIMEFAKKLGCNILIQNFQYNKTGRSPSKQMSWSRFYGLLKEYEKKYSITLSPATEPIKTKELSMPFKKDDITKAKIACEGRNKNEKLAVSCDRIIVIPSCSTGIGKVINIKIIKAKHNLFLGKVV